MDHFKILRRAWDILWSYRALWLFGVLVAMTSASVRGPSSSGGGGGGGGGSGNGGSLPAPGDFQMPYISTQAWETIAIVAVMAICLVVLFGVVLNILRYVSETALIRMVDRHEESEEKLSVRQGWSLGWSRAAFRLFLIDLLIGLSAAVVFLLLFMVAALPLLVWLGESEPAQVAGTVAAAGLFLLVILVLILFVIVYSLVIQFIRRACVLEDQGVLDSLRRGFQLVRQRLGDVIIMGIILFAISLGLGILMIPVVLLLFLGAVVAGGLPALLAGWLVSLFAEGAWPWIAGAAIGLPVFLLVVVLPGLFISGLTETYKSTTWTLTYREVLALTSVQPVLPEEASEE